MVNFFDQCVYLLCSLSLVLWYFVSNYIYSDVLKKTNFVLIYGRANSYMHIKNPILTE